MSIMVSDLIEEIQDQIPAERLPGLFPALNRAIKTIAKKLYILESDLLLGELSVPIFASIDYAAATIGLLSGGNETSDTITDSADGFVTAGFQVGMPIGMNSALSGNLGPHRISSLVAGTITLDARESRLTTEAEGVYHAVYPPAYSSTYVKATTYLAGDTVPPGIDFTSAPWNATNPSTSLTGAAGNAAWKSAFFQVTNQCFHIKLSEAAVIARIYYENYHSSGANTNYGVKNFSFWGSNTEADFLDTAYANDGTWVELTADLSASQFDEHAAADAADPKYITSSNVTNYLYYRFKIADNWGYAANMAIRRLVLLEAATITSIADFGYMPDDFWGFVGEEPYIYGYKWPLKPLPDQATALLYTSPGTPNYYKLKNNRLYVYPGTSTDIIIKGDYWKKPPALSTMNDYVPWNEQFDDVISEYLSKVLIAGVASSDAALHEFLNESVSLITSKRSGKAPVKMPGGINYDLY